MAVAERGWFSITAISPKISPGPSCENTRCSFPSTKCAISTRPSLDDIDAIARVAFAKNFPPGGELPFLGDAAQALQFVRHSDP